MTKITNGSLTMVGLNTPDPRVFWNGALVPGIVGIKVDSGHDAQRVVLYISEDPLVTELRAAGVIVRKVAS